MLFPFDRKERSKPRAKPEPEHYVGGRAPALCRLYHITLKSERAHLRTLHEQSPAIHTAQALKTTDATAGYRCARARDTPSTARSRRAVDDNLGDVSGLRGPPACNARTARVWLL